MESKDTWEGWGGSVSLEIQLELCLGSNSTGLNRMSEQRHG